MNSCDVVIVGAGPGGATLGYELSRRGVKTLVLEREALPRDKTCAGGITTRTARSIGFDLSPVIEKTACGISFSYRTGSSFVKLSGQPFIHTVIRSRFDHFLVQKAQEAGATVIDGTSVEGFASNGSRTEVRTSSGTYDSSIVVGADGARSTVARSAGLMRGVSLDLALEARVPFTDKLTEVDSMIWIDLGQIPGGYGWVFPKRDHLSIGVGASARYSRQLRPHLDRILNHFGVDSEVKVMGHLLPIRGKGMSIQRGNTLLLGDAAGLIHPFTREGIFYAVRSAQLAAPVIERALGCGTIDLSDYQRAVDAQLMPSIDMGRALLRIFTQSPRLCFGMVKHSDWLWDYVCRALFWVKPGRVSG